MEPTLCGFRRPPLLHQALQKSMCWCPIIRNNVLPGTTIVSDDWAAYGGIQEMQAGYNHQLVYHKTNFVDPKR
ncbi:unnamed protein product [Caenorhabditis nigoni]